MTATDQPDLATRIGEWLPTLLFLLRVYSEDQDEALSMLEPGMPLFEACPIDLTLAWLAAADMVASIGDVGPDQLTGLLTEVGGHLLSDPPTHTEGEP